MATESLQSCIGEIKRNKYCLLPSLSEDDIFHIWKVASGFIQRQMQLHKGVTFPGLGVFTFSQKKIDVGSNKFIVIERPVFVLSEKFVQTHSLQYPKQHTSGQIPTVPLNFSVLSNETLFNRDTVETCIHEVIQAVSRLLAAKGSIQLEFCSVGRLFIRESKVKMRFFREFITTLDSSGEMETAFRPGTTQTELSIMSDPFFSRPETQTLILPRIVETSGAGRSLSLEVSSVVDPEEDAMSVRSEDIDKESTASSVKKITPLLMTETKTPDCETSFDPPSSTAAKKCPPGGAESGKQSPVIPRSGSSDSSRRLVPKPAGLFVGETSMTLPEQLQSHLANLGLSSSSSSSTPRPASASRSERAATRTESQRTKNKVQISPRPATCSHSASAGQELCYLCHQRAFRNVPVDATKDKKDHEKHEDKMLLEYQQRKDLLALAKEQAARMKTIGFNREMASFNLEAAQRAKGKKMAKDSEFHPSYVFQHRPLTPPRHVKQTHYCSELDDQVSHLNGQARERREREEREGREEQVQLAKELEAYQEAYLIDKAAKVAHYQRALAEQIAIKRELGLLGSTLSFQSNSISKATPPCIATPTSACSIIGGMRPVPSVLSQHHPLSATSISSGSKGCLSGSGNLRPLSLPKPTIILPFSHSKTMTILKDGNMRPVRMKPLAQLEARSPPPGGAAAGQPVFGVQEVPVEKLREQRERARELFLEQLAMVAEKERKTKETVHKTKLDEAAMLTKTRKDLIDDIRSERLAKLNMRKSLEQSWDHSVQERQGQLMDEINHSKQPSILLHQQCEKYHRCKQCQRRMQNKGESNLLYESRYISGSRLMV